MNPNFFFEFRSCLDPFNASIFLESAQAKYVTSAINSELKYEKISCCVNNNNNNNNNKIITMIIIIKIIIIMTLLETLSMKIKQLVIFAILNYIFENIYTNARI